MTQTKLFEEHILRRKLSLLKSHRTRKLKPGETVRDVIGDIFVNF